MPSLWVRPPQGEGLLVVRCMQGSARTAERADSSGTISRGKRESQTFLYSAVRHTSDIDASNDTISGYRTGRNDGTMSLLRFADTAAHVCMCTLWDDVRPACGTAPPADHAVNSAITTRRRGLPVYRGKRRRDIALESVNGSWYAHPRTSCCNTEA